MGFSLYIAKRYLFTKSKNNAINIITSIAAAGVVIGSLCLFVVLSGFSGLKDFSLQYTTLIDPDLKVSPASGKTILLDSTLIQELDRIPEIAHYSKIIEERVFLNFRGKNHIAVIKGVDENFERVNPVDSIMLDNDWLNPEQYEVVVGLGTAYKLSLGARNYQNLLEIYVPEKGANLSGVLDATQAFSKEQVVVSGIYEINEELNDKYVFADLALARNLLSLSQDQYSGLEVKLAPEASQEDARAKLNELFDNQVQVLDRVQQNDALYKMLNTENIAVYLIFTLVMIIALFNVIGSIIMMILDKRNNISTLFNLGATLKEIRQIFFFQGVIMTSLGGIIGILLGIILVYLQLQFEWVSITPSLAYPVKFKWINVIVVLLTISTLGMLAARIASIRVKAALNS
ncbi:ABC transporter permease [Aureitalea marina]|uniref:ABC transporter permease n=1 Tax=Aureitalea marina TaxID=930804 RepID=A0A2S7KS86_9FLAO|nr:ABC transporter permease [Aureitalea marina]PQB05438.1 ABC transporter permease [Aureitalea marina]